MNTHPMTLVTIICETLARGPVTRVVEASGAQGYTLFPVEGRGSGGDRPGDIADFGNLQIEVILKPDAAEHLLERLHSEFLPLYAMVVYTADVRVMRPAKF